MKKLILSLAVLLSFGSAVEALAQARPTGLGPEWGETEEIKALTGRSNNLLQENITNKEYGRAAYYLQNLLTYAPKATINIYVRGSNMYRNRAEAATDKAEKMMYLDSLMMMYDMAIENFGEKYPEQRKRFIESKAIDYRLINPLDRQGVAEYFRTAIAELGNDIEPRLILTYFNELSIDYKNDDVSTEEFLMEFDRLYPMVVSLGTDSQVRQLEGILAGSGAANCENLENIFSSRIDAEPENEELLGMVLALLGRAGCMGTDFYLKTGELYFKVNPSAKTAIIIASYYMEKGDNATALRYFNDALAIATDPSDRSDLSLNIAGLQLNEKNYREAYNFASRAAKDNPRNPKAYLIMGMAQAGGAATVQVADEFERQAAYWLVVDNLLQARQLAIANPAAGLSVSDVNKNIAQFQAGFPTDEELFFQGKQEGTPYTVNAGWITGSTTIRKRP